MHVKKFNETFVVQEYLVIGLKVGSFLMSKSRKEECCEKD